MLKISIKSECIFFDVKFMIAIKSIRRKIIRIAIREPFDMIYGSLDFKLSQ